MNDPRDILPALADSFCSQTGLSRSRVSTLVFSRGTKIDGLADRREDIRTETAKRALQWFSDHWPEGAEWPADVARPVQSRAKAGDETLSDGPMMGGVESVSRQRGAAHDDTAESYADSPGGDGAACCPGDVTPEAAE